MHTRYATDGPRMSFAAKKDLIDSMQFLLITIGALGIFVFHSEEMGIITVILAMGLAWFRWSIYRWIG